jgi:DNA (cytosine-5)-methyltransferase 1
MKTFVSLFAGVGGLELGFEQQGWTCLGQVEIDPKASAILSKHWPDVPKHDDVQTAKEWANELGLVGRVDAVCGGFPCQDLSVAGKRAGLAGKRSGLFWDALAFAQHVQARWIILENVPGLLNSNGGADFATVLSALADAGYGYREWRVLDSQFFGVAQRRRRVFIVAGVGTPHRSPILAEREGSEWHLAPGHKAQQDPAADLGFSAQGTGFTGSDFGTFREGVGTLRANGGDIGPGSETLVATNIYRASQHGAFTDGVGPITARYGKDGKEGLVVGSSFVKSRRAKSASDFETWVEGGVSPTLNTFDNAHETRVTVVGVLERAIQSFDTGTQSSRIHMGQVAPTLTASTSKNRGGSEGPRILAGSSVRRLTPVECERLQGFPDDWTAGQSDSSRYKQMGNAITVNVANFVAWCLNQNADPVTRKES